MHAEQDNRTVILENSLKLFAARGYEAVGVAELCEAASVAKPTLYHYYGSKHGLLDAIVKEKGEPLLERIEAAVLSGPAREVPLVLEAAAKAFASRALEEPDFARLRLTLSFAPSSSEGGAAITRLNEAIYGHIEVFFLSAEKFHGNMKGRALPYTATFIGTIDTYVGLYLAGKGELSEDVLKAAVRQFMYGIFS